MLCYIVNVMNSSDAGTDVQYRYFQRRKILVMKILMVPELHTVRSQSGLSVTVYLTLHLIFTDSHFS